MARYFFNIYNGRDVFDETGTVLNGDSEMRLHMLAVARTWIEKEEHQDKLWSIEARDEEENLVGSVRFGVEPQDA